MLGVFSTRAWYLHMDREGRMFFKDVQNVVAKLKSTAEGYTREIQLKELQSFLETIFKPDKHRDCYQSVIALTPSDELKLDKDHILLVVAEPAPGGGLADSLKGLDLESRGEFRSGAYQELARGFGVRDYTALLGNDKANEVRLMTATEFGKKLLRAGEDAFSESLLRHTLFAIREVAKSDQGAEPGRAWLKAEVKDYWSHRKTLIALLQYLSRFQHSLPTWQTDSKAAALLAGALENDH